MSEVLNNVTPHKKSYDFNVEKIFHKLQYWAYQPLNRIYLPFFSRELSLYQRLLRKFPSSYTTTQGEVFEKTLVLGNNDGYVNLTWQINIAKQIIERDGNKPIDFPVYNYVSSFQTQIGGIEKEKLPRARISKHPVIFADCPTVRDLILIDGNHRFFVASNERKLKTIPAYILTPQQSLECMCNDNIRTLFKIYHNIRSLIRMENQPNIRISMSNSCEINTIFPLYQSKFSNMRCQKLLERLNKINKVEGS